MNFQKMVDEFLQKEREERDESFWETTEGEYHQSHGSCMRKGYYKQTIESDDEDASSLRNFKLGHMIEELMYQAIDNSLDNIDNDYIIEEDFNDFKMVGETDPVQIVDGEVKQMFEVKSTRSYKVEEPKDYHVTQVMAYMGLLDLDECYILYVGKQDLSVTTFKINFDQERYDEWLDRIKQLDLHLDDGVLPEGEPTYDNECKWCNYKDVCDEDYNPLESKESKDEESLDDEDGLSEFLNNFK